ncbi:MAG: hypothetical protein ACXABY_29320 [Candidatus Thorarchaeota archaeon]
MSCAVLTLYKKITVKDHIFNNILADRVQCNNDQCDDNKLSEVKSGNAVSSSFMRINHITAIGWVRPNA